MTEMLECFVIERSSNKQRQKSYIPKVSKVEKYSIVKSLGSENPNQELTQIESISSYTSYDDNLCENHNHIICKLKLDYYCFRHDSE